MHAVSFVKATIRHDGVNHGGETHYVDSKCTEICGQKFGGTSCATIMLAEIFHKHSNHPPMKLMIRSLDGTVLEMPTLIECDTIPNNRSEIPTPEVARNYPHLTDIADSIPPLDPNSSI
jgi:hypothetical protein